jgi:hypothetical protein
MDSRKSEWGIHDFRRMVSPQICKEDKLRAHNTPVGERIRRERFPFGADEMRQDDTNNSITIYLPSSHFALQRTEVSIAGYVTGV